MIHILTIHYNDRWVDLQLEKFAQYIKQPYNVYTILGNNYEEHKNKFHYAIEGQMKHYDALDTLRKYLLTQNIDPDDIVIVIDSDAFPVCTIDDYLENKLSEYQFLAINEPRHNYSAVPEQPFECFYAFRYKFFETGFDFHYEVGIHSNWIDWMIPWFQRQKIDWYRMNRSNKKNLHDLYYGVYDNMIFHSWCGSFESRGNSRITRPDRIRSQRENISIDLIVYENIQIFDMVWLELNNNFDVFIRSLIE